MDNVVASVDINGQCCSISGHKWTLLQVLVDTSGHCYKCYWTQVDTATRVSGHKRTLDEHKWTMLQALVDTSGHCR